MSHKEQAEAERCVVFTERARAGVVIREDDDLETESRYAVDAAFDAQCSQQQIYQNIAADFVEQAVKGYSATIMAYGQTGSGKTFSMRGFNFEDHVGDEQAGLLPRIFTRLFE